MNSNTNNNPLNRKLRTDNSTSSSSPISSTPLFGRTRKISTESQQTNSRPLKRATSLSYRVFTPTQMVTPSEVSLTRSQSVLSGSPRKSPSTSNLSTTSSSNCVLKFRRRLRSLRRSPSTNSQSQSSLRKCPSDYFQSNLSSSDDLHQLKNGNSFNNNLESPPSSPTENSDDTDIDHEHDNESYDFDTSCFSHLSNYSDTPDSSYQFSPSKFSSSSCESSPFYKTKLSSSVSSSSLSSSIPKFKLQSPLYVNKNVLENIHTDFQDHDDYPTDLNLSDDLPTIQSVNRSSISTSVPKLPYSIFEIPEILEIILRYVAHDYTDTIPTEPKLTRRPPLSYNHSIMMYGEERGKKVWKRTISNSSISTLLSSRVNSNTPIPDSNTVDMKKNPNLYNCLFVNKKWYFTMLLILNEHLYFKTDSEFENYTSTLCTSTPISPEPISLVLHKIKSPQSIVDIFASQISSRRLDWLEFYICPSILPPLSFISHSLKKLVLPGCRSLNDDHLKNLITRAPGLVHLDIRACDQITDASLYFIGENCPKLEMLNCGRHSRGELVSDVSIGLIAKNCPLRTIGLAGCGVSDWAIWELGLHCGTTLERLSLNYCWKLTDVGICRVLKAGLMEALSVLEIRGVPLTDIRDIVHWKRRRMAHKHNVLIEACEHLDGMMKEFETQLDLAINTRIFNDIGNWLQSPTLGDEDDDVDYRQFLQERRNLRIL